MLYMYVGALNADLQVVISEVKHDVYGKRQTAKLKLFLSLVVLLRMKHGGVSCVLFLCVKVVKIYFLCNYRLAFTSAQALV